MPISSHKCGTWGTKIAVIWSHYYYTALLGILSLIRNWKENPRDTELLFQVLSQIRPQGSYVPKRFSRNWLAAGWLKEWPDTSVFKYKL